MYNWFECKIKYDKTHENGMIKTVTEPYLVDALSFTEAEARIVEEIRPYIRGEFAVANISRKKFAETFFSEDGDRFYNARLAFITLDEKGGGEKRTTINVLVQACTVREALDAVEAEMNKTAIDYTILGVSEMATIDVFPYSSGKDNNDIEED